MTGGLHFSYFIFSGWEDYIYLILFSHDGRITFLLFYHLRMEDYISLILSSQDGRFTFLLFYLLMTGGLHFSYFILS